MMRPIVLMVCTAMVTLAAGDAASARSKGLSDRELAEHACYNDAQKLCPDAIPDEAKITKCMGIKREQLSPACRKVYDAGTGSR